MKLLYGKKKETQGPTRREKNLLTLLMAISILLTSQIGCLAFVIALSASHRGRMFAATLWMLTPFVVWIGSVILFRHFVKYRKTFPAFCAAVFPLVFFISAICFFNARL